MTEPDSKRYRAANPEAIGEREKELWTRVEPIIDQILGELRKADKIKTASFPSDMNLPQILRQMNEFSEVYNFLIDLIDSEHDSKEFLESNAKFGLDGSKLIAAYIIIAGTMAVLSTEFFKLLLLFFTKDLDNRVDRFKPTMKNIVPNSWPKLEPFIDNKLRNAIAHGNYAVVDQKVRLFKNAKLEIEEEMSLSDFMMRLKNQNVLGQVLIKVILRKAEKGFFIP